MYKKSVSRTAINFSFSHVPPVFKRGHQVMIAIFNQEKQLCLARKHVYPPTIYRFFGGGVEPTETADQAAIRECQEETHLHLSPAHQHIFNINFEETTTGQHYQYQADLFYATLQSQSIHPGDDVNTTRCFSSSDFAQLIENYQKISTDLTIGKNGEPFRWSDWGSVFNQLNKYVLSHWLHV